MAAYSTYILTNPLLPGAADELLNVQKKVNDVMAIANNPLANLESTVSNLIPNGLSSFIPDSVSKLLSNIPNIPSLGLDLNLLGGFGDCFRNIEDIIAEMLKKKIADIMTSTPAGLAAASFISTLFQVVKVVQDVINKIIDLANMSLMDLISLIQNSPFLAKIPLIAKLKKLYGKVVGNINKLIAKIMSLDPCNLLDPNGFKMPNYGPNGALPEPGKIPDGPPEPFPTIIEPAINQNIKGIMRAHRGAKARLGQICSVRGDKKFNGNSPGFRGAHSLLHKLAHNIHGAIHQNGESRGLEILKEIEAKAEKDVERMSEDVKGWFQEKMLKLFKAGKQEAKTIADAGTAAGNITQAPTGYDAGAAPEPKPGPVKATVPREKVESKPAPPVPPSSNDGICDGYTQADLPFLVDMGYTDEAGFLQGGATCVMQTGYGRTKQFIVTYPDGRRETKPPAKPKKRFGW